MTGVPEIRPGDPLAADAPAKDHLPDPGPPPESQIDRIKRGIRSRKGVVAALAALYATWKAGRWVILLVWNFRGWDEVGDWAADHWVWLALGLAAVFAATFVLVRAVIPRLTR